MEVRLQKILSQWGIASRRQAEQLILAGQVTLNGKIAQLGQSANPDCDQIEVEGQLIQPQNKPAQLYLLLNKPKGVVTTCHDPNQRSTVLDLLPPKYRCHQGLHPVGRLDTDSTGALLLTNDGQLTFALTHPRHHVPKTYRVWVAGHPPPTVLHQWQQGVCLDGRLTRPAQVRTISHKKGQLPSPPGQTQLEIILQEGKNRQIRRVAEQLGYPVLTLHRTRIGPLGLHHPPQPALAMGHHRSLTAREVRQLKQFITRRATAQSKECHHESRRP